MTIEQYLRECVDELQRNGRPSVGRSLIQFFTGPIRFFVRGFSGWREGGIAALVFVIGALFILFVPALDGAQRTAKLYPSIPVWILTIGNMYAVALMFYVFWIWQSFTDAGQRRRRSLLKQYWSNESLAFSNETYKKAAVALESYKRTSYDNAVNTYGKEAIDLLIIVQAIEEEVSVLRRIVSIGAIKQDREANEQDDMIESD